MPGELDCLRVADGKRLAMVARDDGMVALPRIREPDRSWRRARPGDGVAEALLAMLHNRMGFVERAFHRPRLGAACRGA